jgi:NAD(P)-dependent dehydrogenase (short-subunit alcohol dehydrogenase family)
MTIDPTKVPQRHDSAVEGVVAPWELSLTGRVYIVTGAASGIGKATARTLSELGAGVVAADIDEAGLAQLAKQTPRLVPVAGDCSTDELARRTVAAAHTAFGELNGLVANVGVAVTGRLEELTPEQWQKSLDVNLTAHFLMVHHVLRYLVEQGRGGSLVFVGSKNAYSPGAGFGAYSAAKAGMVQLARIVALEGAPAGVRSNIVCPDNVFEDSRLWTDEIKAMRAQEHGVAPSELEGFYQQRNLLHERILPSDVARAIALLLSDWTAKTTGCVLTVDGGIPGVFPR